MRPDDAGALPPPDPILTADEREALKNLDFFAAEIDKLAARGLLPGPSHETVLAETEERRAAIQRLGRARGDFDTAKRQQAHDPSAALRRLDRARASAPEWAEPWALAVTLLERLGRLDEADALREEARGRSHRLPVRPQAVKSPAEAWRAGNDPGLADPLAEARQALKAGRDDEVVRLCSQRLSERPDHFDAIVLLAFARQRLGQLPEALALYQRLTRLQPDNPVWRQWRTAVEGRLKSPPRSAGRRAPEAVTPPPKGAPAELRISWRDAAGEFLQDHWQKLILCLAVLLIVVSSNIGAYQLLGPRLWSPAGKCILALVYTAVFAGFGTGLVRWGAERAGRIMLLTTLILVPANFLLIGETRLLAPPTAAGLSVLTADAAALLLLVRLVGRSLGLRRGAGTLTAALFALSACNAAATHGQVWWWGWHFALFQAPAVLFLGAAVRLLTASQRGPRDETGGVTDGALALLAFVAVTALARTGEFTLLHLPPTFYAAPLMLFAIACVFAAPRRRAYDPDPRHAAWLQFTGLVLSALALTLALARPPLPSPLFSGNTLAAALLGLGLYAALLRSERKPAYLYFSFGALFLAYFGAFDFVADLVRSVEEAASRALGYRQKLPPPFKAINGLVFNATLALLALRFGRVWGDPRLARHCHYIGVPFSVAAGAFSFFEPLAGLICLGGYALLYAAAVRVFHEPRLIAFAAAALAGAALSATSLAGVSLAGRAFAGAILATGYAFASAGAGRSERGAAYRRPLGWSAVGLAALASSAAVASALPEGPVALTAAAALAAAALAVLAVNLSERREGLAYAFAGLAALACSFAVLHGASPVAGPVVLTRYALAAAAAALALAAAGDAVRRAVAAGDAPDLAPYPRPLLQTSFLHVGLALLACGVAAGLRGATWGTADCAWAAGAFGLSAAALVMLTRAYPEVGLAQLATASGLGCWACAALAGAGGPAGVGFASYGAAVASYAVALVALEGTAGAALRRFKSSREKLEGDTSSPWLPTLDLFATALPHFEVGAVLLATGLGLCGLANSLPLVFTLAAGATALFGATQFRRSAALVELALVHAVAAALALTAWRLGWSDVGLTLAWLALTAAGAAVLAWALGRSTLSGSLGATYAGPCFRAASQLTWGAFGLALCGRFLSKQAFPACEAALLTDAVALLLLTTVRARPSLTFRAVIALILAAYVAVFSTGTPQPDSGYVLGLVAVTLALGFSASSFACRSWLGERGERLYAGPLMRTSMVLTFLAAPPALAAPRTMGLVALSFLLLVKGLPSQAWIYPTLGALAYALHQTFLVRQPAWQMVTFAMVAAYQLWLLGLLVRRFEPALRAWFRLPSRGYDAPVFHSAVAFALLAAGLRADETLDGSIAWTGSAGLALNLAAFSLAMLRAYPRPVWLHLAVALASGSAALAAGPVLKAPADGLVLGMVLAHAWGLAARGAARFGRALRHRLGMADAGEAAGLKIWSHGLFAVASGVAGALVLRGAVSATFGLEPPPLSPREWWALLATLALGAAHLPPAWWARFPAGVVAGAWGFLLAALWWSAGPLSPRSLGDSHDAFVLATAAFALLTALGGFRSPRADAGLAGVLSRSAAAAGAALAVLGGLATLGWDRPSTFIALLTAALVPGAVAAARGWVPAAYAAGLAALAAGVSGSWVLDRSWGVTSDADRAVALGAALFAAAASLWACAAGARRSWLGLPEGRDRVAEVPAASPALAFEHAALAGSVLAALALLASATTAGPAPSPEWAYAAVGVFLGLALFHAGMIARWRAAWLVYPAQGALAGSYLYYRAAFPVPAAADALVMTLFGYVDFGLAEVLERAKLSRLARPTRYVALALPLAPLGLAARDLGASGPDLFVIFGTATFYAITGSRFRWKWLGYASAVLYNAFLWFLWGRIGWRLTDHPQFFLVPVGLSAILFAEVNVKELGRQGVNAVRGAGLVLVYLSLAAPVWQTQSFGAWLALLVVTLAGIFAGIALRAQAFLWVGLAGFVLDVGYQLVRVSLDHSLARWGIMLVLGVGLVLFVALNEKKKIVATLRESWEKAKGWE